MISLYFDKLAENSLIIAHLLLENLDLNLHFAVAVWLWIIIQKNSFHRIIIRKNKTKHVDISCTAIWKTASAQPIRLCLNLPPSFKNATISGNSNQLLVIHHRNELVQSDCFYPNSYLRLGRTGRWIEGLKLQTWY